MSPLWKCPLEVRMGRIMHVAAASRNATADRPAPIQFGEATDLASMPRVADLKTDRGKGMGGATPGTSHLRKSNVMAHILEYPVRWFLAVFVASNAALYFGLQTLAEWNASEGSGFPGLDAIDASSVALQAIVGTAVVGASAIVALLVAVAALRTSQHQNELTDPDYELSHAAHAAYRKYVFLAGTLISSYRRYRHLRDLAAYGAGGNAEAADVPTRPEWSAVLTELQDLLLSTPFQVAALEAARVSDFQASRTVPATGRPDTESSQHALRRGFETVLAVLQKNIDGEATSAATERVMTRLLAEMALLDAQLVRGLRSVVRLRETSPGVAAGTTGLLPYLMRWMHTIPEAELGNDYGRMLAAVAFPAEAYSALGEDGNKPLGAKEGLGRLFSDLFGPPPGADAEGCDLDRPLAPGRVAGADGAGPQPGGRRAPLSVRVASQCTDPLEVGFHKGMTIAAVAGDHTTVLDLRRHAARLAADHGWTVVDTLVRSPGDLRPPSRAGDNTFHVWHVTRKTLPLLFHGDRINRYTRGCVIIDGLRSPDLVLQEDRLLGDAQAQQNEGNPIAGADGAPHEHTCLKCPACGGCSVCRTCARLPIRRVNDLARFVHRLALDVRYGIEIEAVDGSTFTARRREFKLAKHPRHAAELPDDADARQTARLAWIGIDYRQLDAAPPSRRRDDDSYELWSVFGREGIYAVSDEAGYLLTDPTARG